MAKTFKTLLAETTEDLKSLVQTNLELLKLKALESGVPAAVSGAYFAIIAVIGSLFLFLMLFVAAFAFGLLFTEGEPYMVLRGLTLGFLCLCGVLLLTVLIMLLIRESVCHSISAKIITKQLDDLEQKDRDEAALHSVDATEETTVVIDPDTDIVQLD